MYNHPPKFNQFLLNTPSHLHDESPLDTIAHDLLVGGLPAEVVAHLSKVLVAGELLDVGVDVQECLEVGGGEVHGFRGGGV